MLINNILRLFYNIILTISQIINVGLYTTFRIYNYFFDYLNNIEIIINRSNFFWKIIVMNTTINAWNKLFKYYFKIEKLSNIFYNIVNIFDSIFKLNIYKKWNKNETKKLNFETKYKTLFENYFYCNYNKNNIINQQSIKAKNKNVKSEIIRFNNALWYKQ